MTVARNIAFGLRLRRMPAATVKRKVAAVLDLVGMSDLARRYPAELSGGQQQRVAIARCVVLEPKILLMDEPFSNLDSHLRVRLRDEVHAIQRRLGLTTIFVTHDQEEALTLADKIAVMDAGHIEQVGPPAEIYAHPRTAFVAGFIGTMNLIAGEIAGGRFRARSDHPSGCRRRWSGHRCDPCRGRHPGRGRDAGCLFRQGGAAHRPRCFPDDAGRCRH